MRERRESELAGVTCSRQRQSFSRTLSCCHRHGHQHQNNHPRADISQARGLFDFVACCFACRNCCSIILLHIGKLCGFGSCDFVMHALSVSGLVVGETAIIELRGICFVKSCYHRVGDLNYVNGFDLFVLFDLP